jgi:hypothetical protein
MLIVANDRRRYRALHTSSGSMIRLQFRRILKGHQEPQDRR